MDLLRSKEEMREGNEEPGPEGSAADSGTIHGTRLAHRPLSSADASAFSSGPELLGFPPCRLFPDS